ncbi:hypothetical protein ACFL6S_04925 [Candidatus Poribacteria bacterium]
MRKLCLLWIISSLFLSGCATGIPLLEMPCPPGIDNADISTAMVSSLQQNEFPVLSVNPETGLVVSDWRETTTAGALISGTRRAQALSQRIKLEFSIDQRNQTMIIRPRKQQESKNDGWNNVSLDDRDMLLVQNVALSAVSRMGGPVGDLQWVYQQRHDPGKQGKSKKGSIIKGASIASAVGATMVVAFVLLESLN